MKRKGIIFDLDGTLIDSLDDIADACNRTLLAHGFPTHPADAYKHFIGDGLRNLIIRALPEDHRDDQTIAACSATYSADYGRHWDIKTHLYPGMADALSALAARGLRLNVLSNKPDEFTQACARRYLAPWSFSVIMGASDRFAHKPDPAAALEIARILKLPTGRILYVGDMPVDMITARNAGFLAIGATWGFRSGPELLAAGAHHVIDHPAALVPLAHL